MSTANVVDSSGWLEYLADTNRAQLFAAAIEDVEHLIVPVITIFEVCKKVFRERGENAALQVAALMQSGRVIDLDTSLTLVAMSYGMPMADSLIYATSQRHGAILWTQDEHFKDLSGVRYFPKNLMSQASSVTQSSAANKNKPSKPR